MTRLAALLIACAVCGCDSESRAPLEVSDIRVFAPLPGSSMSVAYMVFENHTDNSIVVSGYTSPQFATIELHETRIDDGVARMYQLEALDIAAGDTAVLEENRKHLMLMNPASAMKLNDTVTLHIAYDNNGMLIVNTPLRPRAELEVSQ